MICSPRSEIAFSQVREDPLIEWQLVQQLAQRASGLRVLLVASGGCTALSLLAHPAIAQIDAVDLNPAQLQLAELKRYALIHLPLPEQLQLLGIELEPAPPLQEHHRLQIYQRLRPHLPDLTRSFWDARLEEIAFGVNRVGRFEQLFRELAAQFAAIGLNPLYEPQAAIHHPQWSKIFQTVFERTRLIKIFGESAVNYSMDRSFGDHFADGFAQALQRFTATENYFLTQVWGDRYTTGSQGMPPYLQATVQDQIRQLGVERLRLYPGSFEEQLTQLAAISPYDLIQFSNLSDWMPIPALHQMVASAVTCLKPGGILLGRRLNGDHQLATIMAEHVLVDQPLSQQLRESDRSFFYREVVVGVRV